MRQREMRKRRVREMLKKNSSPRLSVWRTNSYIYAQVIDDRGRKTMAFASSRTGETRKTSKSEAAYEVGKRVAAEAVHAGIKRVVFDRGNYAYHGRVRRLAEGAREGGLEF